MKPVVPRWSSSAREVAKLLIPRDEHEVVYEIYAEAMGRYIRAAPLLEVVDDPPEARRLDEIIRLALVALAKKGVANSLSKMAWMSYALTADDYVLEETRPEYMPAAVMHRRLHQSDFYLSEFRRLREHQETDQWLVTLQSPDGRALVQKPRVFPMWGIEHKNRLDNHQKAKAWYRQMLQQRGLVK